MTMLWIVIVINGTVVANKPVGNVSMKTCNEMAAKEMMRAVHLLGKADFQCVRRTL